MGRNLNKFAFFFWYKRLTTPWLRWSGWHQTAILIQLLWLSAEIISTKGHLSSRFSPKTFSQALLGSWGPRHWSSLFTMCLFAPRLPLSGSWCCLPPSQKLCVESLLIWSMNFPRRTKLMSSSQEDAFSQHLPHVTFLGEEHSFPSCLSYTKFTFKFTVLSHQSPNFPRYKHSLQPDLPLALALNPLSASCQTF